MNNYQVLARKWRPRNFAAFVGQEHVVRALTNALEQKRLHHAYLFTGTRGVGKTTLARILAKCFNCEKGISANPCGECTACREIDSGRFVDLIEVDAASRTKVEDTRELLENVQYAPSQGRFKIYLIDEVHMLSNHSFNALLKTLEEPPPHIKFLIATTDPQKLPITVISRCLQFHLKNLSPELITNYLSHVLQTEQIPFEDRALTYLARAAKGSMRDALSLLDQTIAYGNGNVNTQDTKAMLGTLEKTFLIEILNALAKRDPNQLMAVGNTLDEQSADFAQALEELLLILHQIAMAQAVPNLQIFEENEEKIENFAKQFTPEEIQLYYQIGILGRQDLPLAPTGKIGFEMILLRMFAFCPNSDEEEVVRESMSTVSSKPVTNPSLAPAKTSVTSKLSSSEETILEWTTVLNQLNMPAATRALAAHCTLIEVTQTTAQLVMEPSHNALLTDKHKEQLAQALTEYFQRPMKITISVGSAATASPATHKKEQLAVAQMTATTNISQDQNIQALFNTFNATIMPDSTKSLISDPLLEKRK